MFNRNIGHSNRCKCPICCPPNIHPTQIAPAQVSPTQHVVRTNIFHTVVPHIHPTHITTINRHVRHNEHYFPVTQSTVNEFTETNRNCGTPENPNPNCHPIRRRGFGF
ncbi:CotD family spore coat protein [Ureibacillus sp. NPDC094379]